MIKYVPGKGWVHSGDGGSPFVIGGEMDTKRTQDYLREKQEFADQHHFKSGNDYSGTFGKLFGAEKRDRTPTFGSGPNSSWGHALNDRLERRKGGMLDGIGHFESRLGTTDRDYQARMFERNNAIEDMYRRGFSRKQISDHLAGNINALEVGPDWADYRKEKRALMRGNNNAHGLLTGNVHANMPSSWHDEYFIGAPAIASDNPLGDVAPKKSFMDRYKDRRSVGTLFADDLRKLLS